MDNNTTFINSEPEINRSIEIEDKLALSPPNSVKNLEYKIEELENKLNSNIKFVMESQTQLIQEYKSNISALEESLYKTREGLKGIIFIQGTIMVLLFIINLILNLL